MAACDIELSEVARMPMIMLCRRVGVMIVSVFLGKQATARAKNMASQFYHKEKVTPEM